MNKKAVRMGIVCGVLLGTTMIAYAITTLFYTKSVTSHFTKKTVFQFDLTTDMVEAEVGPGDCFDVEPVICNDGTKEMYVFMRVDVPVAADGALYSFDVDDEWIPVSDRDGTIIYAYAGSEMIVLQPGESTCALTEQMTMNEISYAEYAGIDNINVTITGYAIGTEDVPTNPSEAWELCKYIGDIQ